MVKPEFFDDPEIADLSPLARLFFIGLWLQADREGRLEDEPRRLKARIFPYDPTVDVSCLAVELHGKDMIRRYVVDGKSYIWIRTFTKHQRPHPKEPASLIPACENEDGKRHGEPCKKTARTSDPNTDPNTESGVRNLERCTEASSVLVVDAFLSFPVIGTGSNVWQLSEAQVAEWARLFPGLDVRSEAMKALAWVGANPGRRKTDRGMAKFLVGWLTRAVDSGGARLGSVSAPTNKRIAGLVAGGQAFLNRSQS